MGNALRLVVTMVVPAAVASAIPAIVMAAAAMMPMPVTMAVPDLNYRVVLRASGAIPSRAEADDAAARTETATAAAMIRIRFMVSSRLKLLRSGLTSRSERRDERRMARNWRPARPVPAQRGCGA
jgi:uncharacterized protein YqjF (DUF2071 family)